MLEPVPPGQQPIMMMTTACTGMTLKAKAKANAAKGMMPNWQRKPMKMPQGLLTWPHSLAASTVQPMENMTIASMMVRVVLIARLRIWLKLSGGTRQLGPEQTVARASHSGSTADVAMAVRRGVQCRSSRLATVQEGEGSNGRRCRAQRPLCLLPGKESKINQSSAFYGVSVQKPTHIKRMILKCHSLFDHSCSLYRSASH